MVRAPSRCPHTRQRYVLFFDGGSRGNAFSMLLRECYWDKRNLRLVFINWDRDEDGRLSVPEVRDLTDSLGFAKCLGRGHVNAILTHYATGSP
ncbi:hypothetical protein ATCC90586_008131 [Pythium insidiosum]|nr:hypothetical protein ATCC90586_008131 [Pythium insidiosum]